MTWNDEKIERLRKLWFDGLSASQIAAELGEGVTRNAVIGAVHRLGLSSRSSGARLRLARTASSRAPRTEGSLALAHEAAYWPAPVLITRALQAETVPHWIEQERDAAEAVRNMSELPAPVQADLESRYPGYALFGIESDPVTYLVEDRGFAGRAALLIDVPLQTRSGERFSGSVSQPVRVKGRINRSGKVSIKEMDLVPE